MTLQASVVRFTSGWVSPSGSFYANVDVCPEYRADHSGGYGLHNLSAEAILDDLGMRYTYSGDTLAGMGWAHVSTRGRAVLCEQRPTQSQIDVLFDMLYEMPAGFRRDSFDVDLQELLAE